MNIMIRFLGTRSMKKLLFIFAACLLSRSSVVAAPVLKDPALVINEVASGLNLPTTMAFIGPDDILVLQKNDGRVRRVSGGILQASAVLDVNVDASSERGLLGIALHPNFPGTPFVYLYFTESATGGDSSGSPAGNRVYRYTWNGSALTSPALILDLPATPGPNHDGGIIRFGPDGKLYVLIGDLNRDGQLQNFPTGPGPDDTSVILRLNDDGTTPSDNPFFAQGGKVARYYAYGIRNSFGMAFDPLTGILWITENGPDRYDEINMVEPGFNSGWEQILGPDARDPNSVADLFQLPGSHYRDPKFSWLSTVGPTGMVFLQSTVLGAQYQFDAFVGDINNGNLYRFKPNATRDGFVFSNPGLADLVADNTTELDELIFGSGFNGITDLKAGVDGRLYVVSFGDGKIYAISSGNIPPPDTQITGGPLAVTNLTNADFTFVSTTANSTFACKLDGGAFAACASPKSYGGLAAGSHTFQVRATDQANNTDPTPATFTWTIDTAAPETNITSGPVGTVTVRDVSFSWTGTDDTASVANLVYAYRLDPIELGFSPFGPATAKSYSNLANGSFTFYVKAKDQAGNEDPTPASQAFAVNVPASNPTISLTYDGQVRDRVGQNDLALSSDGQLDGVFTVTLDPNNGNRTVSRLDLTRVGPIGIWDTVANNQFWAVGAANGLDSGLLNANDGSVNFLAAPGSSFKIFVADFVSPQLGFPNGLFAAGSSFTLRVTFSDDTTATGNVTIGVFAPSVTVNYDGQLRDRVGQNELALNPDGELDGVFTVTLNSGSGNRTVNRLQLNRAGPIGVWDTQGGDGFWSLGAASGLDTALLNAANDSVNFMVTEGSSFKIFAADYLEQLFVPGSGFSLNVNFSDGSTATANVTVNSTPNGPTISLNFDGTIRDRVGQKEFALAPDGQADGVFTVTLNAGSGNRTVNRLQLNRAGPIGVWDTQGGDGFWSLGAASGLDTALLNAANDSVSFAVTEGSSFKIFAADYLGQLFVPGSGFSLNVNFSDGSTATANVTVNSTPNGPTISLNFDGMIRDRVGQKEFALAPDGQADGVFTVTLNAGSGNRTVNRLQLNRAGPIGVWDTQGGDGFWSLGAASGLDTALLNAANDSVNFMVTEGSSFKIFAADYQNLMFVNGTAFTLAATFADGSTATANFTP
jgi:glucose/arabinose dehydrogenase